MIAVLDACALYPSVLRDLFIRLALRRLYVMKFTKEILDEVFRNIRMNRPDLDPERLDRTRRLMETALDDTMVDGYQELVENLSLPDRDDRHVLAAALHCQADCIVTFNLKDFPIEGSGIDALHPNNFLEKIDLDRDILIQEIEDISVSMRQPRKSFSEVAQLLKKSGLTVVECYLE